MPEVLFDVEWPDGSTQSCYSPSLIVEEYLRAGQSYPVPEFVRRAREALGIASERVRAVHGFPCSLAAGSLAAIESTASRFVSSGTEDDAASWPGQVTVRAFRR